jgi:hypothetical protein
MARVGAHVANAVARRRLCVEQSTVQPISRTWRRQVSRTVESNCASNPRAPTATPLRREDDPGHSRVNGRAPRAQTRRTAPDADPNPLSPEPLAFLLPEHREECSSRRCEAAEESRSADRRVHVDDRTSKPELIEDEHGHDDCFDWSGPVATRGRVWVDATTYDVLRVDRRIDGLVDVRVPSRLQDRYHLAPWVVIERDDQTCATTVARDPDDVMLLPIHRIADRAARRPAVDSRIDVQQLPPFSDRRLGRQRALSALT